jgi:hypothetical protein
LEVSTLVKLSEIEKKISSRFLRGEDVKSGDVVTIVDEGEFLDETQTGFGRPAFRIKVRLESGEEKLWTVNRTSLNNLKKAFGDDTKFWVGRKVRLETSLQNVRGQLRTVIIGFPVVQEEDLLARELRDLVNSLKQTGMREISKSDFQRFLTIKGLKVSVDEALSKLNLKVEGDVVKL